MSEHLRFYVYSYSVNGQVVYFGKGTGDRCKAHLTECRTRSSFWHRALRGLLDAGVTPDIEIVASDLTQADALKLEASLIKQHGTIRDGSGPLYNTSHGEAAAKDTVSSLDITSAKFASRVIQRGRE